MMHNFILCHHQLSKGHQKTHTKISDSLLATVQCSRLHCHLLNFLAAGSQLFFICKSDIIGHVHDKVLEPPCFLSTKQISFFLNFTFKTRHKIVLLTINYSTF